jgi:hypothetical protein
MKILQNYEEAFQIGKECLDLIKPTKKPTLTGHGIKKLPEEVDGPWEMTETALANTLKYVFDLSHVCYLICVIENKHTIYKIQSNTLSKIYERVMRKSLKRSNLLKKNVTYRIMQCTIKPFKTISSFAHELDRFLDQLGYKLPNGVFIWTASDSMILRKDGTAPWHMLGSQPLSLGSKFIPLLAYSGHVDFWDVPVTNVDDILQYGNNIEYIGWESKKPVAVFRGGTSGCGYTADTNMRLKLSLMRSPELDVGVVQHGKNAYKFDPKEGLGKTDSTKFPIVPKMPMSEQAMHKYIIHIDGNVAAYRLLATMMTGSLILKVEGPYTLWIDHVLKPGKHYIPVKADLSDLLEVVEWCKNHDDKCKKIALNGYEFAKTALTKDYIDASFAKVLWAVK